MKKPDIVSLDSGRLEVTSDFVTLLRQHGLDSFDRIMALPLTSAVRSVPGRSTVRVKLGSTAGYLKRYSRDYVSSLDLFLRLIHWPGMDDEAAREWRKLLLLREHGFLTAEPIAMGQRRRCGVVTESFLLQQEICGGMPADQCVLERLGAEPPQRKWRFVQQLGALARRFQEAGFIHKDFYLNHVFVVGEPDNWKLYLIDLQRVLGPRRHRQRWYIKDLAALAFSARSRAKFSRTNLLRLYKSYAGVQKLSTTDKRSIQKIWRHAARMLRRRPKYRRIWNAPAAQTTH